MKTKNKRSIGNVIISVLAITLVLIGLIYLIGYIVRSTQYEETNNAQVESYINPVSARAGGYISKVLFEEQQQVKAGDTLVILDNREYQVKVNEAEAALEDVKAQMLVLETGIRSAEVASLVSNNQIASAKSRLWQQNQDNSRYRKLLDQEAVTGQEYEQVRTRYEVAQNDYLASLNNLRGSKLKVNELEDRRALLQAEMKRRQALLDFAKINLKYTVVTSPFSGQTGKKTILEGQQIQAGQPLVSIVNERQKWVTANFKETQVSEMYPGQPVEIRIDGLPGEVFEGKVEAISASTGAKFSLLPTDNATGNFVKIIQRIPVKIVFTDQYITRVRAGMNVTVAVRKQ